MRVRLVIELDYPMVDTEAEVDVIKDILAGRVVGMARDKLFNVENTDIQVGEVMTGVGVICEEGDA